MTIAVQPSSVMSGFEYDREQELLHAHCAIPFSFLGLQDNPAGRGLILRAWRPDALRIDVSEYPSGKLLGSMVKAGSGLFELSFPRRRKRFNYQLTVFTEGGQSHRIFDPYQFGEYVMREEGMDYDALYRHQGAHLLQHSFNTRRHVRGVLFRVYAPNARSVSLVGDFNQWDGRIHPMASADDGIWRLFVPELDEGTLYKYEIHDARGNSLPLKADPFGRYAEQWPGLASIVHDEKTYRWKDESWLESRGQLYDKPMSVYEVHPGSWQRTSDNEPLDYKTLAKKLIPYVKKMGFTHIELMPVSEHPLYESWGYQTIGMFAPTSRYGSPDDFKYFVDRCHQAGIGVILDWVPAHFPNDEHGLAKFDGTSIYEHPDPKRGWHPDWKTCIYDFGRPWVQDFLISSALYWLDEFHIDGLRVDAVASMLYLDYSRNEGEWEPNVHGGNENLEAIAFLRRLNETIYQRFPTAMTIAEESTSFPGVSRPVHDNGLGFGYKWNMGWMHDSLEYMKEETVHRKHHHGKITFSTVYAWSENFVLSLSHDEVVYGKGTLLTRMPGDEWQKFANLRTYLTFMFTHPGKKLLFMGGEFGTWNEWNHHKSLDWPLIDDSDSLNAGIQKLTRKLNKLYQTQTELYELDCSEAGFQWLVSDDQDQSVLAYARFDKEQRPVITVLNMTPAVRHEYLLGVPVKGKYKVLLNTDAKELGGSGVSPGRGISSLNEAHHGFAQSIKVDLPPLAAVILKPEE
ncbi:1,4-alpha-glucan branching protein GlgB [Endozoicomonas arenosclerae]|uniref:1,4-alpha-glucan branching protein GlgB n=1 Tax=Endozoicomonas arenosclerae TaxID=1633495 RepID=UPI0009A21939|nr:1,4-alpha-glucan branching protein GlgB [Endozoicomonas arenosclerae]